MRKISLAHSPDADDIFMYYAIAFGWVGAEGFCFDNCALDIQTLNEKALEGHYDVTAISFALYPHIAQEYALLRTAASFGEGYGPKLVKRQGHKLKPTCKVALSGAHTTNAMLFRIAYPKARIVYKNFLHIEQAVIDGEVDAGVLIHENILTYDSGLEVERELWDVWSELSGGEPLLPLGGMALRRSIPLVSAITIEQALIRGVQMGLAHPKQLATMLYERQLLRVDSSTLERYLQMYANEASAVMRDAHLHALDTLFAIGYRHGFYPHPLRAADYMIPDTYAQVRYS